MKSLNLIFSVFAFVAFSTYANAADCERSPEGIQACFRSPHLKWAASPVKSLSPSMVKKGPSFSPAWTSDETENATVFCQYYHHRFDSGSSAKFRCARTTPQGVLLDKDGNPVPEAKSVSTEKMELKTRINGKSILVDEGMLLDRSGRPLIKRNKKGEEDLVEADSLHVKYTISMEEIKQEEVYRRDLALPFGSKKISLKNAFMGSPVLGNYRWNEVFTEVASTRVFWALGLPADTMIPVRYIVCYGCDSHPTIQRKPNMENVSVFQMAAVEKKFPGKKLGEQFNINEVLMDNWNRWSDETQHDFEATMLASRLIGFHNPLSLQSRITCEKGQFDDSTGTCRVPVPFMHDLGSSWGGKGSLLRRAIYGGYPRGMYDVYKKESVFANKSSCTLYYPYGSSTEDDKEASRRGISQEGLEKFKARLKVLTPEVMQAIFETARFADMEPVETQNQPGYSNEEKRRQMIRAWVKEFQSRVDEIMTAGPCRY